MRVHFEAKAFGRGICGCFLIVTFVALFDARLRGQSSAEEPLPHVESNFQSAAPRAVEEMTQHSIHRDYIHAWESLDYALASGSSELLHEYFTGQAKTQITNMVMQQAKAGIKSRCLNQNHKLEAIFYSPEGDVMELRDTAQCDLELIAAGKTIHREHAVVRYVVLMTPAADRWMIRQLQAVPQL